MAKLLPVKENFLCRQVFKASISMYKNINTISENLHAIRAFASVGMMEEGAAKLTKEDIEKVFSLYDRDNSGTIENEELKGFLKDLLELVKKDDYDAQDLKAFEETILRGVGYDKDGKISRKELTMILLTLAKMPPEDEQ
uniref:EF-hand domain-containing protein n=1 Tax=Glossina morsitans morsitans TaxID=37546 RepID=A0A1B0FM86_GLOMM